MNFAPITTRLIGSMEVLAFALLFELVRGSILGALAYAALFIAFFLGRAHFAGDFSLTQLAGLFDGKKGKAPP